MALELKGKALSAFLGILRSHGVTEWPTADGPIRLAPPRQPVAARVAQSPPVAEESIAATEEEIDDDFPPDGDFRFALEKLTEKNFPGERRPERRSG